MRGDFQMTKETYKTFKPFYLANKRWFVGNFICHGK